VAGQIGLHGILALVMEAIKHTLELATILYQLMGAEIALAIVLNHNPAMNSPA